MDTTPERAGGHIYGESETYRVSYGEPEESDMGNGGFHASHIDARAGCLIAAIVFVLIAALILWVVGSVLSLILPVLIPVLLVVYLLNIFHNRR